MIKLIYYYKLTNYQMKKLLDKPAENLENWRKWKENNEGDNFNIIVVMNYRGSSLVNEKIYMRKENKNKLVYVNRF